MRRRDFMLGLGGAALCSKAARGQPTLPIVGVLAEGNSGKGLKDYFAPAQARLAEMGFVEGRNLTIEYSGADYKQDRLAELASELVQRRVAAIVTMGGPPTVAAKAATRSIPIIFRTGFDPVASGYVESLNRPGGNVTGIFILNPQLIFKRIEMLHELVPEAKTIAFFYTETGDATAEQFYRDQLQKAADPLGVNLLLLSASHVDELEQIFAKADSENAGAIVVNDHAVFAAGNGKLITELAARYKIPTMYPGRFYVGAGGLMSYGSDSKEANRQLGDLVGRVLKGEKPENSPVQQVTKLELVINAKVAKSLGLVIPLPLLGLAEVIE
jgi:putative tryptophan/tyrosine transport system substrate-binding protein